MKLKEDYFIELLKTTISHICQYAEELSFYGGLRKGGGPNYNFWEINRDISECLGINARTYDFGLEKLHQLLFHFERKWVCPD